MVALLLLVAFHLVAAPPVPKVFLLDGQQLAAARHRLAVGDEDLSWAVVQLKRDATNALKAGPFSVINKDATPPSGDKHDYMSLAPYFWPNPNTSNGLPYIRRDGERNPEIYKIPNRLHLGEMADAVETLSLAYYFTGDETFAARAALLIRTWFLDPATRMNPHLQFGQAIRGINTGRGIGIIETRAFARVVDSVGLLAGSKAWAETDQKELQSWYRSYLKWLLESSHGRDEAAAKNNHGTYYDVQVASFALFIGDQGLAKEVLSAVGEKRIAVQVEPDGRQPLELERTRAWSYSVGNLAGLMSLARLGEHVGLDLWHYESRDGRSIRQAFDYLRPFGVSEQPWPYKQIDGFSAELFHPVVRLAARKYPKTDYVKLTAKLPPLPNTHRTHLLLSPMEPVNRLHRLRTEQD